MYQIFSAVSHCHSNKVLHRDLKPENLLIADNQDDSPLKVIDFGISRLVSLPITPERVNSQPHYTAPECFNGVFSEKSDMWSCGVIMYIMLCGYFPFIGQKEHQTISQILNKEVDFSEKEWSKVSKEAKDLISRLLNKSPEKRPEAQEVLIHPWIQIFKQGMSNNLCLDSVKNLINFRSQDKIQHATFEFIVSHLSSQKELKELQNAFMILDKNGDGKLSREEITSGIEKVKFTKFFYDIEKIIEECDADGSDFIDYSEFLTAAMDWRSNLCKKKLETAFKTFDLNGDGKIDLSELKEIIGGKLTEQEYKEILKEADLNGDGVVDYKEFEEICIKFIN